MRLMGCSGWLSGYYYIMCGCQGIAMHLVGCSVLLSGHCYAVAGMFCVLQNGTILTQFISVAYELHSYCVLSRIC